MSELQTTKPTQQPASASALSEELHHRLQIILKCHYNQAYNAFVEGEQWSIIRDKQLWKYSGTEARTFEEFCEKEIGFSRETVNKRIRVFKAFGKYIKELEERNQQLPDWTRLRQALPYVERGDDPQEWIHRAITCNPQDYNDYIREAKGKPLQIECLHEGERRLIEICLACGKTLLNEKRGQ